MKVLFAPWWLIVILVCAVINVANAADCLAVFPQGLKGNQSANNQLINFPPNSSGSYLANNTVLARGDNYYLGSTVGNQGVINVASPNGVDASARLFFRTSVSWQNVKINQFGNASDLIIVVDGSLTITGGNTVINAIIYVKGAVDINGNGTLNGAVTAVGASSISGGSVNYQPNQIGQANFNGMCDNTPVIPISCAANTLPAIAFQDNFSSVTNAWQTVDFQRNISSWPGQSIYNSSNENQTVIWRLLNGQMEVQGNASSGGDNEYGMVSVKFTALGFDQHNVSDYAISADITANKQNTNNDTGIVFSYQNSSNFFLARWTKYGASYVSDTTFPGVYRRLEIIKVSNGVATSVASKNNFDVSDAFNIKVVVNSQGTAVCINQIAELYTATEKPLMRDAGILSYDNDTGVLVDNFEVRCTNCVTPPPLANFQFDECSFSGNNQDVIDQTGNYSGTSQGGLTTLDPGKIIRAANLNQFGHHILTNIPLPMNYTVSTWFKKPTATNGSRYFVLGAMQGGSDLMYIDRGNSWRWGVYTSSPQGSSNGTFSFNSLDNNWHHLALVYQNSTTSLYIDGQFVESLNRKPTGTLRYLGASYDYINTSNAQGFRGPLDEFIIFSGVLSANQVNTVYQNQLALNNYDGTTRATPPPCYDLVAFYRFEENNFNAGIADETGNGFTGSSLGGLSTAYGKYCRGFDTNGQNSTSTTSNAFQTGVDIDDHVGNQGSISFWYNSNSNWNTGGYNGGERTLFDASLSSSGKYFTLEIQQNGRLRFAFEDSNDGDFYIETPSSMALGQANRWYYLTATWDYTANIYQIYVDGNLSVSASRSTNGTIGELDKLIFGDNSSSYGANGNGALASYTSADGRFDEVRIYNKVLTQNEIVTDLQETFGCPVFDHFEIDHDGNGLTCEPEIITIKACADASCTTIDTTPYSIDLLLDGVLNQTVNITGTTTANISVTTPSTVTLAIGNPYNYQCSYGANDCNIKFDDVGFKFLYNGQDLNIANQESATPFAAPIVIQALKDNNGVCTGLFNGNVSVGLAMEYQNPNNHQLVNTYTVGATSIARNLSGAPTQYTPVNLLFNSESKATLPTNTYNDAGQILLKAKYQQGTSATVEGASNSFWVRPSHFTVSAVNPSNVTAIDGNSASSTTIYPAGKPFDFTINALNSSNQLTHNYQPASLAFQLTRLLPNTAVREGSFSYFNGTSNAIILTNTPTQSSGITSFVDGKYVDNTASYNEVGIFSLEVSDASYPQALGNSINNGSATIGRFVPAYFGQTILQAGDLTSGCGTSPKFAYSGQKVATNLTKGVIGYDTKPILAVTPYNFQDQVTQNYVNELMKLTAASLTLVAPTQDNDNALPISADVSAMASIETSLSEPWIQHFELSDAHHFTYTRSAASQITPFTSNMTVKVSSVVDGDSVSTEHLVGSTLINSVTDVDLTGVEIRFARWRIDNSFGPETSNLAQPMWLEYFDGSKFAVANDDNCTVFNATKFNILTNTSLSTVMPANGNFVSGFTDKIMLRAPGENNTGSMDVEYDVFDWFKFDWDNGGLLDDNPTAVATFGIYRGNDRIIYWRELGQ